jgi:hypothetical protein
MYEEKKQMSDTQCFQQARIELGYEKHDTRSASISAIARRAQEIKQSHRVECERRQARLMQNAVRNSFQS